MTIDGQSEIGNPNVVRLEPPSFEPPQDRPFLERHTPKRLLYVSDITNPNAQEYYFPTDKVAIPDVNRAARFGVFTWEQARETGYQYNTGGTCFLLHGEDGKAYLVTQAHCLEGLGAIEERSILFDAGMGSEPESIPLRQDEKVASVVYMPDSIRPGVNDIAIIDVSELDSFGRLIELPLAKLEVGEPIFSVGYPHTIGGKTQSISLGTVQDTYLNDTFRYNCLSTQGQSGGPLLNVHGEVVGMVWLPEAEGHIQGHPQTNMLGLTAQGIQRFINQATK